MKIKNIIIALLVLCLTAVNFVSAQEAADYTEASKSLEIFENLSVTLPEKDMGDIVTRAEFVSMIMHAADGNEFAAKTIRFSDVYAEYEYAGEIYAALDKGIISLTDEFRPNDEISYADACAMAVRFLGRERFAANAGGYPNGYLTVARDCELDRNISCGGFDSLTFANALVMMKNIAECKMFSADKITSSGVEYNLSGSLFEEKYDMFEIKGIETADMYTTLFEDDKHSSSGTIRINDDEYHYSGKDYLGYRIKGYAREIDGINYIVYAEPYATDTADILLKDISVDNGNLTENGDNAKSKKYSVAADACIIYNGKAANRLTVGDIDKMEDGHITLIDNDDDGEYDILSINEYSVVKINSINIYDETILDENGNDFLDLSDKEINYTVLSGENEISLEDIKSTDVLCVYKSLDGKKVRIVVENNMIKGKLSAVNQGNKTITVAEQEYEYSNYVEKFCLKTAIIGQQYLIYVSEYGTVIHMQIQTNEEVHYGYLVSQYAYEVKDEYFAKIYTDEGSLNTYKYAKKVKFDDAQSIRAKEVYDKFKMDTGTERQLIRFKVNSDMEIVMIDTQNSVGRIDSDANPNDCLSKFKFPANVAPTLWYIRENDSFHPYFYVTEETKIFIVSPDESVSNEDRCILETPEYLRSHQSQKSAELNVYDVTQSGVAGAIVIYDNTATNPQVTTNCQKGIVYSISPAIDPGNEGNTYKLVMYIGGQYHTYYVGSSYLEEHSQNGNLNYIHVEGSPNRNVEKGDFVGFEIDSKGKISAIECYFDMSENALTKKLADNGTGTHTAKGVLYSGKVYTCSGNMVTIIPDGVPGLDADAADETARFSFRISSKVYMVNEKCTNIYESDISELLPYKLVGDKCGRIFICCSDGVANFAVVYKR